MNNFKNTKFLKLIFINLILITTGFFSFFLIQYLHMGLNINEFLFFIDEYTRLSILSIISIIILQIPMNIVAGSVRIGSLINILISFVLGFVNYQKMKYRPEPLFPSDISMIKDITFLFNSMETRSQIFLSIVILLLVLVISYYSYRVYSKKTFTKKSLYIRFLSLILCMFMIFPLTRFGKTDSMVKNIFEEIGKTEWIPFNQIKNYNRNGVIAGLLYNLSSQVIIEPDNYNKDRVLEIVEKYRNIAENKNAKKNGSFDDINIVFIMNESFADPMDFEGMTIKPDPLPNYREIIKNTSAGRMLSQGYGGGTANIEFEALTGISLEPMLPNISIVYTQLTEKIKKVPSVLDVLNHHKTAIHPFQSSMYKRPDVYSNLGFDNMLFDEDMKYQDTLESSLYISDEASYKQVFDVMNETIEKDFVHLVTMQGHGPYYVGYFGNLQGFQVEGPVKKMDMLNYLSSLSYSDDALKFYIDQVNEWNEKTITVFWGDHLPSAISHGVTSLNKPIKKYLTPVFIHSNFDIKYRDLEVISPIYYMNELLIMMDVPITPYYALLGELQKYLPAFEKEFHIFNDIGNIGTERLHSFDKDVNTILEEYELLIYDIFEGKNYFEDLGFYNN